MLEMLRDLIAHKDHANATLIAAVRRHDAAAADIELRELLHHVLLANRFWLLLTLGQPFVFEEETRLPGSLDALIRLYRSTQQQESWWVAQVTARELEVHLENPLIPGTRCSVAQAFVQVCMHSQGHRSQCAKMLRRLGGVPPVTDFIVWLTDRPAAQWPLDS